MGETTVARPKTSAEIMRGLPKLEAHGQVAIARRFLEDRLRPPAGGISRADDLRSLAAIFPEGWRGLREVQQAAHIIGEALRKADQTPSEEDLHHRIIRLMLDEPEYLVPFSDHSYFVSQAGLVPDPSGYFPSTPLAKKTSRTLATYLARLGIGDYGAPNPAVWQPHPTEFGAALGARAYLTGGVMVRPVYLETGAWAPDEVHFGQGHIFFLTEGGCLLHGNTFIRNNGPLTINGERIVSLRGASAEPTVFLLIALGGMAFTGMPSLEAAALLARAGKTQADLVAAVAESAPDSSDTVQPRTEAVQAYLKGLQAQTPQVT